MSRFEKSEEKKEPQSSKPDKIITDKKFYDQRLRNIDLSTFFFRTQTLI